MLLLTCSLLPPTPLSPPLYQSRIYKKTPWSSAPSSSPGESSPCPSTPKLPNNETHYSTRLATEQLQRQCPPTNTSLTSGTGYIGSFTALALLEADYKVVIVDNLYNSSDEVLNRIELICGKRPEYEACDITDEKKLDAVFEKHPDIDNVIHFAALKVSGMSRKNG